MKQLLIAFLLVISTVMVGQERQFLEGEMELGGGLFSFGISDGFELVAIGGVQAQFDYDFLKKSGHLNEGRRGKVLFVPQTSFTRSWHKLS